MKMENLVVMFFYVGKKFVGLFVCFVVDEGRLFVSCVVCVLLEFCG